MRAAHSTPQRPIPRAIQPTLIVGSNATHERTKPFPRVTSVASVRSWRGAPFGLRRPNVSSRVNGDGDEEQADEGGAGAGRGEEELGEALRRHAVSPFEARPGTREAVATWISRR